MKLNTKTLCAAVRISLSMGAMLVVGVAGATVVQAQPGASGLQDSASGQPAGQEGKQAPEAGTTQKSAAEEVKTLQSVVVTGIKESQIQSISLKRLAPVIQDSITAENIGQLPDFTIADSLSRITGVQILHQADDAAQPEPVGRRP